MIKHVDKVWGSEHWLVNNELYCGKLLHVAPGMMCSLHRHPVKDETFHVLEGSITLQHGDEIRAMHFSDSQRIPPGTWHRFWSHEGAIILEISTHHDDADVERRTQSGPVPSSMDM